MQKYKIMGVEVHSIGGGERYTSVVIGTQDGVLIVTQDREGIGYIEHTRMGEEVQKMYGNRLTSQVVEVREYRTGGGGSRRRGL